MESTSPIHEWVEKLEPGDLIRVSYGSRHHYIGVFKGCRKRDNDWLLRYYDIPHDVIKITDIRCKNHLNTKDEYRSIPRSIFKPPTEDADGV